jgi:hypothetical protein
MPRYYFHFRNDEVLDQDEDGIEYEDDAEAMREADTAAREMLTERLKCGERLDGETIEVLDASKRRVGIVSLADIVKRGLRSDS